MNDGEYEVTGMLAYQGKAGCTDVRCRHMFGPNGRVDNPTCFGYHCAVCDEPSSMYGHADCGSLPLDPFEFPDGLTL